jgi:2-succinyl-5-enolpyruvyl-6-hydroxy-3-cyclohexene-1-carboxylate synthase
VTAADTQATFCATLVDEWVRRGVRHAVVAPGSRSTPMAVALAMRADLAVHVVHDERAAAFVALGLGLDGVPAVLLCTSGTAAANFHPAVVEAGLSDVPMLVLTADRPPELREVGAAQTIDQTGLFGRSVRWFHDPGVPDRAAASSWRSLSRRAHEASASGPVHLNLPFREPLVGTAGELPAAVPGLRRGAPRTATTDVRLHADGVPDPLESERGVILAGGRSGVRPDEVAALAAATGWPVLADPLSGCRRLDAAVTAFDALLRHDGFADDHRPEVIIRLGRPAASKSLGTWVASSGATLVQVGGPGVIDPDHRVGVSLPASAVGALADQADSFDHSRDWVTSWTSASQRAERVIEKFLGDLDALSEPGVARVAAESVPDGGRLVVASSMPVRDLEWFGGAAAVAHANRGANGIDGVVSTALGLALHDRPVVALVGDIAFLHDGGALTALAHRRADLRIVVVDNDGGGIFSFLPQASALAGERFEQLFGTPHGTDVVAVARAHGLDADTVTTGEALGERLGGRGPTVTRVPTDRASNVAIHAAINAAVADAL